MREFIFSFIKFHHLAALGLNNEFFYFILMCMVLIIIYVIIHPFIQWIILLKLNHLLSYIISSLFVFIAICLMIFFIPSLSESKTIVIQMILQVFAFFGVSLIIFYSIRKLIGKT
ncbi:hypothetical protein DTX80_16855 [Bacilli bacterium]|uniref:Uncharacterized protein n=1 Tax=Oceanobacillus caeni TaxID=405946 RepID=A0ABR5MFT6_9BACI|nr:hypothetical protein WH51_09765 [Bacilli bacterium VT-13-104]KPH70245.1 hypothetical protein AFL42_16785 [Oceanobacillus caeni]PZD83597.1 hypothetical protein DEJ64_14195 [Bacilli bacterium]PZD85669.1 hypothetical protein DEJ60_12015 [Bacilli bacterium]PZD88873.1 hypothetical protein DEJ66_12530 [Bacilli bacterium]